MLPQTQTRKCVRFIKHIERVDTGLNLAASAFSPTVSKHLVNSFAAEKIGHRNSTSLRH